MSCGIYKITCKETGRCYIGQSMQIEHRWYRHRKRFPVATFDYEIVVECLQESLDFWERHCIDVYEAKTNGFNITIGGNRTWGWKNPEETKRKIGDVQRGKPKGPQSIEQKLKSSITAKNRPFVECPHCGLQSQNKTCMNRWHFDNCKKVTNAG